MYHKIGQPPVGSESTCLYVPQADLREQCNLLKKSGYQTTGFSELSDALHGRKKLPPRPVIITFDDGFMSVYEQAYPVLQEFGFQATVFVVAEFLGKESGWSENSADRVIEPLLGIKELNKMDNIEIGSHANSHRHLTRLTDEEVHKELVGSKSTLQDVFNREIITLCYPYGDFNEKVAEIAQEAGYLSACCTKHGNRHTLNDLYCLKRVPVTCGLSLSRFKYRLSHWYDWEYRFKQS
ncbi:MAG: polysaccharide deacetylase family protein [bacterium]